MNTTTTETTPDWVTRLEQRLGAQLRLSSGRAIPRRCPTCGTWCATGYDAPVLARQVWADPHLLTATLEAACVILDRHTYRAWTRGHHVELTPRHTPGLPVIGRMASADTVPVIAEHICGLPPLSTRPLWPPPPRRRPLDEPPF